MSLSNCLLWAIPRWLRNYWAGEALVIRRSTYTWAPHVMRAPCIDGLLVLEFMPRKYPASRIARWLPFQAILFSGDAREGSAICWCETCRVGGDPDLRGLPLGEQTP